MISLLIFAKLGSLSSLLAEVALPFLSVAFPLPFPFIVLVVVVITLLRDRLLPAKRRDVDFGRFITTF